MFFEIILPFIRNIALLMSLSILYSIYSIDSRVPTYVRKLIMGLAVSIIGFIIMSYPYETAPGILFDGRSIIMITSGMYLGPLPTIIGGLSMSIYRLVIGGSGTIPGLIEIILPGIVGLIWRTKRLKTQQNTYEHITILEQYLLIFFTQAAVLLVGYLFPNQIPYEIINQIFLPIMIIHPLGGLGISLFMLVNRRNFFTNKRINETKIKYDTIFNNTSAASFLYDPETKKYTDVNQTAIDLYGYNYEEFLTLGINDLNPLPNSEIDRQIEKALNNEKNYFIAKHITKHGHVITIETNTSVVELDNKKQLFLSTRDISHRVEKQHQFETMELQLNKTALSKIHDGVILTDQYGEIKLVNKPAKNMINPRQSLLNRSLNEAIRFYFKNTINISSILEKISNDLESIQLDQVTIIQGETNKNLCVTLTISPLVNQSHDLTGFILIMRDITLEKEQYDKIEFISQHDAVTSLYNRFFLDEELKRLNTKRQLPLTLIIGDVNGLKLVNDAFGHNEGDELLIEISKILQKALRAEDILGRWGGDEFLIILPQTTYQDAQTIVHRIHDLCQKSFYSTITPSISLGVGSKTNMYESIDDVIVLAEQEMYAEKTKSGPIMRNQTYHRLWDKLEELNLDFADHHKRCAKLAERFGTYLNLSVKEIEALKKLANNHDIGKLTMDQAILNQGYSTSENTTDLKLHVENGYRILNALPDYADISKSVLHHHENFDGSGYPEGLKREAIPYLSRILRIIEAYDSMVHDNNYGKAKDQSTAINELKDNSGKYYDPTLTDAFIQMITQSKKT
ncbi:MAG: diguanylate cyclase [Candidatus Izemoplasma sp.]|nr:diguanylate cyclase [Candidatus Izemoplasma sp.]